MSDAERSGEAGGQESGGTVRRPADAARFFLSASTVALVAAWLYRRAPGFAYFNDDPTGHFAWMEGQTILDFFAGSADYGYYRPIVFLVLRLSERLFGSEAFPHNPAADHALLLLLHAVNAALVWALARRLSGRDAFAWVVALVFAFVPFSYEAVAYVASLTHPLVVFWTLTALLLYDCEPPTADGQDTRYTLHATRSGEDKRRLPATARCSALALLAITLGLLTHESGLFMFPALVGVDWVRRPHLPARERARHLWPFVVPPLLFAVVWLLIPKSSEQGLNSPAEIARNLVPFLQTLVYPLLPLFRLDAGDVPALAALAAATVVILGFLAWRAGTWRLWVFALSWIVLSALPALLFLGPAYVYGSPRLSYLPSVGVAMMWGLPVLWAGDWRLSPSGRTTGSHRRQTADGASSGGGWWSAVRGLPAGVILTALYVLAIVLPPIPFIRCQLDFYDETSRFARQMAAAGAAAPAGQEVVFINAPFFFSSTTVRPDGCPSPYPWTPIGGILIPPYAQARDFVRFNGGPDRAVSGVAYDGYGPGWRTFGPTIDGAALRGHAATDAVYVFDLLRGTFADLSAAWQPDAAGAAAPLAVFGGVLALTDARSIEKEDAVTVTLDWRVLAVPDAPAVVFVHIYDTAGALVAQSDGPPGDGLAPQVLWQPGDRLGDKREIDMSALPPGLYTVAVGVYNAADGSRLAVDGAGQAVIDNALVIDTIER